MGLGVRFVFNSERQELQKLGLGFGHSKSAQAFGPAVPPPRNGLSESHWHFFRSQQVEL